MLGRKRRPSPPAASGALPEYTPASQSTPLDPQATITAVWERQQYHERWMRWGAGGWIFFLLTAELWVGARTLRDLGIGKYHLDAWTMRVLFGTALAQMAFLARLVVTHLFPGPGHQVQMLEAMTKYPRAVQDVRAGIGLAQGVAESAAAAEEGDGG